MRSAMVNEELNLQEIKKDLKNKLRVCYELDLARCTDYQRLICSKIQNVARLVLYHAYHGFQISKTYQLKKSTAPETFQRLVSYLNKGVSNKGIDQAVLDLLQVYVKNMQQSDKNKSLDQSIMLYLIYFTLVELGLDHEKYRFCLLKNWLKNNVELTVFAQKEEDIDKMSKLIGEVFPSLTE
ncbi:hypothetical protein CathTA2_0270 [Caldalkalibacillus thermarum TA2.A1]|uniref:Uncharacterized protein n=1 Tax=Caldalkalibacillus thermarum (strain TA2.A1) TaxID=986075 RepID=F5L3A9_CALTT|nr:hypothetical protein [Caldalkalibacillus thermarum]EGL84171.1 hypothetical protein CathTA2_0270 [Caldalkalibacillus thermarum TA2.A1]QZT33241.1 hypothetical protein HUR95_13210 [Caldalkalibacillus thermarum TA2.A1]